MLFEDLSVENTSTYMPLLPQLPLPPLSPSPSGPPVDADTEASVLEYGSRLLRSLFQTEIDKRIALNTYKTATKTPVAVSDDALSRGHALATAVVRAKRVAATATEEVAVIRPSQRAGWDRHLWTADECCAELLLLLLEVVTDASLREKLGELSFDKDFELSMRFVAAAASLRSSVFSIPLLCYHDAKGSATITLPPSLAALHSLTHLPRSPRSSISLSFLRRGRQHYPRDRHYERDRGRPASRAGDHLPPQPAAVGLPLHLLGSLLLLVIVVVVVVIDAPSTRDSRG